MQNKPNLPDVEINANSVFTKDYEDLLPCKSQKNKAKTNPIKPNSRKAKMDVSSLITKDYRKNDDFLVRINKPNSNPIYEKTQMDVSIYYTNGYENKSDWTLGENKPKQSQFTGSASSYADLFEGSAIWPDEAVFSFDLAARPVILNTNIRQLRRPMKREQFEQFKARKETYHVH